MSYKGYRSKESYLASKKKDYEKHKPHIREYHRRNYQEHKEGCISAARNRYKLNKILYDNKNIQHRRRIKMAVLTHYGNDNLACVRCGFDDIRALSIDHINGGGRLHKREMGIKTGTEMYRWLKKNDYPDGYQTLCFNCQWIKRDENHEYHNYQERKGG